MAEYMADTSDTATFSDTPNAEFYRKLAKFQPELADWMLQVRNTPPLHVWHWGAAIAPRSRPLYLQLKYLFVVTTCCQASPDLFAKFREVFNDLELFSEHWHELNEGRDGLRIFATAPDGSALETPLVALHSLKKPFAHIKARDKLATNLIHPDFQAAVLHWLLFDEHEGRREELSKFLRLLHRSQRNAKIALRLRSQSRMEQAKVFLSRLVSSRDRNLGQNDAKVAPVQVTLEKTTTSKVEPVLQENEPVSLAERKSDPTHEEEEEGDNSAAPPTTHENIKRSDSMHVDDLDDDDQITASDM